MFALLRLIRCRWPVSSTPRRPVHRRDPHQRIYGKPCGAQALRCRDPWPRLRQLAHHVPQPPRKRAPGPRPCSRGSTSTHFRRCGRDPASGLPISCYHRGPPGGKKTDPLGRALRIRPTSSAYLVEKLLRPISRRQGQPVGHTALTRLAHQKAVEKLNGAGNGRLRHPCDQRPANPMTRVIQPCA